jgi:Nucleotide modification associated domain 2
VRVFAYVIEHDLGFAPNPFHGRCTLACCKPRIRKVAGIGDLVLGMGAAKPKLSGHLCYWMRVDEILTFDAYWHDPRFRRKRPVMSGSTFLRYGDNIYHHENGEFRFRQEDSFHSQRNGVLSVANLRRDTAVTDKVLVGREFAYWGRSGIKLPKHLSGFAIKGPGHKSRFSEAQISNLITWLETLDRGLRGEPAHWQFLGVKRRRAALQRRPKQEQRAL